MNSTSKLRFYHLADEVNSCSFAVDSLLDILSEVDESDFGANVQTLSEVARKDQSNKFDALLALLCEHIGEIKISGGLCSSRESAAGATHISFMPSKRLLDVLHEAVPNPGYSIVMRVSEGYTEKGGASVQRDGESEAPDTDLGRSAMDGKITKSKGECKEKA